VRDELLEEKLGRVVVPAPAEGAKAKALERALVALRNAGAAPEPRGRAGFRWMWAMGMAVAAWAVVLIFHAVPPVETTNDTAVLDQVAKLFPDRLEAVVERRGLVDVVLAPSDVSPSDQPIVLVLSKGREVIKVLSYSGRRVCLRLSGREACVEVLAEGNGNVIVAGKDFIWSKGSPVQVEGFSLRAHALTPTS